MKRILVFVFALTLFLSACTSIAPPLFPPAVEKKETEVAEPEVPQVEEPALIQDNLLPVDPAIRIGSLENGLTYYIRHNDEPMNRAELWLAVNAGSILEDEDQLGLAHFLEHMLFNGTENFEGTAIVDFLEYIGMEFGPDINAYTSFDETVYKLQVPTDDAEAVGTAFDVLRDWTAFATISPEEVDKERGVIVEEWRLHNETANGRISDKFLPFVLNGSRYADRLPIGDMDVVRNQPAETLRRYYETWYRPDLIGIVAVGDFDVDEIEALIQEHFSDLSAPSDPVPRQDFTVPPHDDTQFLVITDPEMSITQIQVIRKRDRKPFLTTDDFRDDLVTNLFYDMLNERLSEIARAPDAPFLGAFVSTGPMVRSISGDFTFAIVEDDKVEPAFEVLLTEVERVRRHGFTQSELERAKNNLLRRYRALYDERENINNGALAHQYLAHFLTKDPISGIEALFELSQEFLPEITLEEANAKSIALTAIDNRSVIVTAPEKEEIALPSEQDLVGLFEATLVQQITPYEDEVVDAPLIAQKPEPVDIIDEQPLGDLDVTVLELANGVHVYLKATDFKNDQVLFRAISPGGLSLVSDEDFPEAATIANIISQSGLGELDQSAIEKLLTGKVAVVYPFINELNEGLGGVGSPEDLETLFQLIYLYVTAPREDEDAFQVFQKQRRTMLSNRDRNPNAVFSDAVLEALYGPTIRRGTLPLEEIDALDYEKGLEIYSDRFSDVNDIDFVFVGSFDPDELKLLAQTYLGTLPTGDREETWLPVAPGVSKESVETLVYKGEGDRATVRLVFTGAFEPIPESWHELSVLEGVLNIVLRGELREKLAGVYSSQVAMRLHELPEPTYRIDVSFTADPDRVDELINATLAQIEQLRVDGPKQVDVEKAQAQILSNREERLEENGFWLSLLQDYAFYEDEQRLDIASFENQIMSLTTEDIQLAALEYLREEQFVKAVLYPDAYKPAGE
ncbi:MAG: insulinase family protein [Chloroflexi bacterium]|nr:insulinase family protein [Chloroflexota bacterium]